MRKLAILLAAALIVPALLLPASNFKLKKNIDVPREQTFKDNIISFGGDVRIDGLFEHSLILIGGTVELQGQVGEDIICIASTVTMGPNALVRGDLYVIGGSLERETGSRVMGEFTYFRFDLKKIETTLIPLLSDGSTLAFFKTLKIIFWFIICLVLFAVVPHKIQLADDIFERTPLKVGLVGIVSIFSFIFLLFVSIILSFVLIGIPLLFILSVGYFVIFVFGRTVFFYYIGGKIAAGLKLNNVMPSLFILFGVIFYGLLKFVPLVGPIILIVVNIFEVGIGVTYLLRNKLRSAVTDS